MAFVTLKKGNKQGHRLLELQYYCWRLGGHRGLPRLAAPSAAAAHLLGERPRCEVEKFLFASAGDTLEFCRTYLAGLIESALTIDVSR